MSLKASLSSKAPCLPADVAKFLAQNPDTYILGTAIASGVSSLGADSVIPRERPKRQDTTEQPGAPSTPANRPDPTLTPPPIEIPVTDIELFPPYGKPWIITLRPEDWYSETPHEITIQMVSANERIVVEKRNIQMFSVRQRIEKVPQPMYTPPPDVSGSQSR